MGTGSMMPQSYYRLYNFDQDLHRPKETHSSNTDIIFSIDYPLPIEIAYNLRREGGKFQMEMRLISATVKFTFFFFIPLEDACII